MEKFLEAGKIVNTHGVRGEVRIQPWVDSPEFLKGFTVLYIDGQSHKIAGARVHKGFLIAKFEGYDDVNTAMTLKNKVVYLDRTDACLPEGTFFISDIMGASVHDESGAELGRLVDVLEMPSGNVYVVKGQREILIPAVPEFIIKTDVAEGIIIVRLIDGM